jgi:hypothetical protein
MHTCRICPIRVERVEEGTNFAVHAGLRRCFLQQQLLFHFLLVIELLRVPQWLSHLLPQLVDRFV